MTKEQVETLRSAGISESAIIDRILAESAGPGPENPDAGKKKAEPEKKPEPEKKQPEPEKKPDPEKKPENQPAAPADRTDEVIAAIQKLTGAVLGHNVNGTGTDDLGKSGDEIIGELFRGSPEKQN